MASVSIDEVRRVLNSALGDTRLDGIGPNEPLLRSGLITSIELVSIVVDLERHFGISIPDSVVTAENLDSLAKIAELVSGDGRAGPRVAPIQARAGSTRSHTGLRRFLQRPLVAVAAVAVWLGVLNLLTAQTVGRGFSQAYMAFLEQGARLYPYSGLFSQDDFDFAFKHHQISAPHPPGDTFVAVFGDSGTIGSFLPWNESIPAQMQDVLAHADRSYQVFNLAWFGRLIVKDVMLLELAWDKPMDVAVFTLGKDYFSKEHVARWISEYPHSSMNWPLFHAFVERVPSEQRGPFTEMEARLMAADRNHYGAARRWAYKHFDSIHYAPYFQYLWTTQIPPPVFGSDMRWDMTMVREQRFALDSRPLALQDGLPPADVDERQVQILSTVLRMLAARGTRVVLYLEPEGPKEWRTAAAPGTTRIATIATGIAQETGAQVVDLTWALDASGFLDSSAHYTPAGNRLIAARLADDVRHVTRG